MARNRKGPQHQAKHFQPEDHGHAAHQERAARGHENKLDQHAEEKAKSRAGRRPGYQGEIAPKGPRKGQ